MKESKITIAAVIVVLLLDVADCRCRGIPRTAAAVAYDGGTVPDPAPAEDYRSQVAEEVQARTVEVREALKLPAQEAA